MDKKRPEAAMPLVDYVSQYVDVNMASVPSFSWDNFIAVDVNGLDLEETTTCSKMVQQELDFLANVQPTNEFNEFVDYQITQRLIQFDPFRITEFGNFGWQNPQSLVYVRKINFNDLTPEDQTFFNCQIKKLHVLEECITSESEISFEKELFDRSDPQLNFYYPQFLDSSPMQFKPSPYNVNLDMQFTPLSQPLFSTPSPILPPLPPYQLFTNAYSINGWQTPMQPVYTQPFNFQQLKAILEQKETLSRSKNPTKKVSKKSKKLNLSRRLPKVQRQTPSRGRLSAMLQKPISTVTVKAVTSVYGFCGAMRINPLFSDCRGEVMLTKEVDGTAFFECAVCGTKRRFFEGEIPPPQLCSPQS